MYYQINNVKLYTEDKGQGNPALLFLHFWGGSTRTWTEVTEILKDDYRCISYDHRGWGKSDKPESGYSIKELAADTMALIAELKLDDYIIVGHSMGGKVAQYIAGLKPAGLQGLVLVCPSPAFPTIMPAEMHEGMINAYTSLDTINATIDHVFMAESLKPEIRQRAIEDIQNNITASRLGWPTNALTEDVSEGLKTINVPTLIVAGENDIIDSPERLKAEVLANIADAELEIVKDAGHLPMLQFPETVARLIGDFVKRQK